MKNIELNKQTMIDYKSKTLKDYFFDIRYYFLKMALDSNFNEEYSKSYLSNILLIIEKCHIDIVNYDDVDIAFFDEYKPINLLIQRAIIESKITSFQHLKETCDIAPKKALRELGSINVFNYIICYSNTYNLMVDKFGYIEYGTSYLNTFINKNMQQDIKTHQIRQIRSLFFKTKTIYSMHGNKSIFKSLSNITKTLYIIMQCENKKHVNDTIFVDKELANEIIQYFGSKSKEIESEYNSSMIIFLDLLSECVNDKPFSIKINQEEMKIVSDVEMEIRKNKILKTNIKSLCASKDLDEINNAFYLECQELFSNESKDKQKSIVTKTTSNFFF